MKKSLKITLSIIASIMALIMVFLGVYYLWPWNKQFFDNASEEFDIPGLDTDFCPQGMTLLEDQNKFLICGYMDDSSPSRFYVVDYETKNIEKYFTLVVNDKKFNGHAGGVATKGNSIWTVSEEDQGYCFRFYKSDVDKVDNGGEVHIVDYFSTNNGASWLFVKDNTLWIGEFYDKDDYVTPTSHHLKTRSGEINHTLVFGYSINESNKYGIYSTTPSKVLSVRDHTQGIAVTSNGNMVLSASYYLSDSELCYYEDVFKGESHDTFKFGLQSRPLWYLDNESLIQSVNAPAMSEEVAVYNDRVYILFESACKKYKIFNRKRLTNVYSLPVNYFEI